MKRPSSPTHLLAALGGSCLSSTPLERSSTPLEKASLLSNTFCSSQGLQPLMALSDSTPAPASGSFLAWYLARCRLKPGWKVKLFDVDPDTTAYVDEYVNVLIRRFDGEYLLDDPKPSAFLSCESALRRVQAAVKEQVEFREELRRELGASQPMAELKASLTRAKTAVGRRRVSEGNSSSSPAPASDATASPAAQRASDNPTAAKMKRFLKKVKSRAVLLITKSDGDHPSALPSSASSTPLPPPPKQSSTPATLPRNYQRPSPPPKDLPPSASLPRSYRPAEYYTRPTPRSDSFTQALANAASASEYQADYSRRVVYCEDPVEAV
ncbi:hypothetical protein BDK51DRAFT_37605 [Blyttiomyces helicus]|uniref:Uncharacterized protein n=1 Tax=Blyttiomyces helicus TaxID=388810 RepID=A0A4P9W8A6_9FUNG|nr:hypothetical protein BDK51DRAFT_37605 [Blyttiomyces helicus]|eukprot:RKO88574.1 hypothetical protein BDK51DRAFT_37605 [Blyttiomyces helicus]